MTFYIYETGLIGSSVHVHYSRPGEIISHKINTIFFWNDPESIRVEQSGEDFLIIGGKKKYLFRVETRLAEEMPYWNLIDIGRECNERVVGKNPVNALNYYC